eukprot:CAMPEP_0194513196 /NCGR_PEP_ID=MMETSP0253-20130528/45393_1 /TAXON_ID=2966 /ORGANISM="Noctiluca scintillans" /LENGTH=39 /DNA_ID= /DNA_START= /DNA_END= /DNA_ORIENTATION=
MNVTPSETSVTDVTPLGCERNMTSMPLTSSGLSRAMHDD